MEARSRSRATRISLRGARRGVGGLLALPVLLVTSLALTPAAALATPSCGIEMTSENPYGQQGGVDPFTNSGTSFDRGSGDNAYTITVRNTAPAGRAGAIAIGTSLSCEPGTWFEGPTFTYHWLRNGTVITEAGAESDEYEVTAADEGAAVQCQVTGTNGGGAALSAASAAVSVSPAPSPAPPVPRVRLTLTRVSAHRHVSDRGVVPSLFEETVQ